MASKIGLLWLVIVFKEDFEFLMKATSMYIDGELSMAKGMSFQHLAPK